MKYLGLCLLLLSSMSFAARFKAGIKQDCPQPKQLVNINAIPSTSPEFERCQHVFKQTGNAMCCVESPRGNPTETTCKPPTVTTELSSLSSSPEVYALCKRTLLPKTEKCCLDPKYLEVEIKECPKPTVPTALSSLDPRSQAELYKICMNTLIPGTKNCCLDPRISDVKQCPKPSVLTALSSLNPKTQAEQYKMCVNSLIPRTKNCCLYPIR